jgi:plastocyanin
MTRRDHIASAIRPHDVPQPSPRTTTTGRHATRGRTARAFVPVLVLGLALTVASPPGRAASLQASVRSADGKPLADAVVVAVPDQRAAMAGAKPRADEIDQVDKEFVPHVKAVLVGSAVSFPNHDHVRHHVYSFSPAKRFELPLYAGVPAEPVVFDKPGVVVLGCNIHDWMVGYVYVSESPWFARTGADGTATIADLPPGGYSVRVWQPQLAGDEATTVKAVQLTGTSAAQVTWSLPVKPEVRVRRAPVGGHAGHY